ncbi:ATP-grasp fold amidoligase family protein [Ammoniphilus sp. CFH 90114]|uniref:ATP-grasp fold amidoligase family protein n=1 Tax=Ammoniphilus sp. CFH 90114 TaxID=2493665 RepID=UPI00100F061F|nr:ATP-grasp fold amidoligase family protein [Ammoniphilus sp. CFH 90114]RXT03671.1 glycosyl transferase [Ammoniphilus sp. CFH 90114]
MTKNKYFRSLMNTKWVSIYRRRFLNFKGRIQAFLISDEEMNKRLYKKKKQKNLNLASPKTFSEKVIFLKLYYRNPLVTLCSDKYYVNEYIKACGFEHIIKKTYGVYRNANEIDFSALPDKFFLKCNHIQGSNKLINRNEVVDYDYLKKYYNVLLKRNHYYTMREWGYKNIKPLILCEECLEDKNGNLPTDYKFYCFSGEPKYFMVSYGEFEHNVRNHKFDMQMNSIDSYFKEDVAIAPESIKIPDNFEEMVEIVRELCKPFPHVRVDLYNVDGKIFFGELTFYSAGGFINVHSQEMDLLIGSWINLDNYQIDLTKKVN